jgi:hypothetical protein
MDEPPKPPFFLPQSVTVMMVAAVVLLLLNGDSHFPRIHLRCFEAHVERNPEFASLGWPFAVVEYDLLPFNNALECNLLVGNILFCVTALYCIGRLTNHLVACTVPFAAPTRLQFHLSTAVWLVLVTAVLGCVQTVPHIYWMDCEYCRTNRALGWPMPIIKWFGDGEALRDSQTVFVPGVLMNAIISILLLATIARVLERRIARTASLPIQNPNSKIQNP